MKTKTKNTIVLNKEEAHILRHCVEFCRHRLAKHEGSGLAKILGLRAIKKVEKKLNEI